MIRRVLLAAVGLAVATPVLASFSVPANRPGAFAPRDACLAAPGGRAFAASLRGAIARRDAAALARLAADDVRLDFGGGGGRDELRARLTGPDGGALWGELAEAVGLGCAMSEDDMVFPWIFAQELGDVDPFDVMLTTGPAVPLYRRASTRAAPMARLNWQIVMPIGDGLAPDVAKRTLRRVYLINSRLEGYAPNASLRSPLDYRLTVSRVGADWRIAAFVAGD
jgi:hypothetical protein